MSRRRIIPVLSVLLATAALAVAAITASAGAATHTRAAVSKNLVVGDRDITRSLDGDSAFIPDLTARMNVYDTLLTLASKPNPASQGGGLMIDPDPKKIQPRLAESWKVSNGGTVWTFNLRKGVKSSFGNELTADDVVWSLNKAIAMNSTGRSGLVLSMKITKIEAVSKYVLRLTTNGQSPVLLTRFAAQWYFPIIDSVEAKKHATASDPWAKNWLTDNAAGYGPYAISSWVKGQQIIFKSRSDYWGPKPYFSQVTYLAIPNIAGRQTSLQQGNIQMGLSFSPEALQSITKDANLKVISFNGNNGVVVYPNYNEKPFQDRRVRQAMAKAIEYDQIIKGVYFGQATIAKSFEPAYVFSATERFWRYATNYDAAKKLMADAGYANGFDMDLWYANEHPELDPIVASLVASWGKIGIRIHLQKGPESVLVGRALFQHNLPLYISNTGSPEVPDPATVAGFFIKGGIANVPNYFNPAYERLVQRGLSTITQASRKSTYVAIQKILETDLPQIPMVNFREQIAAQKDIGNYFWQPTHGTLFWPLKPVGT